MNLEMAIKKEKFRMIQKTTPEYVYEELTVDKGH